MPSPAVVKSITSGFGNTLGSIGIVIGFRIMMGNLVLNGVFVLPHQRSTLALTEGDNFALWPPVTGGWRGMADAAEPQKLVRRRALGHAALLRFLPAARSESTCFLRSRFMVVAQSTSTSPLATAATGEAGIDRPPGLGDGGIRSMPTVVLASGVRVYREGRESTAMCRARRPSTIWFGS